MAMRARSGKLVVAGIIVLAAGGAFLLNVLTAGPPDELQGVLSPRPSPTGTGPAVRITPSSAPAARGRSESVAITTACGLVPAVDFDGSFWRPSNGRSMETVRHKLVSPVDPASITLQGPDSALLRTASGQVVILVRSSLRSVTIPTC
jgi:hypothetical protein